MYCDAKKLYGILCWSILLAVSTPVFAADEKAEEKKAEAAAEEKTPAPAVTMPKFTLTQRMSSKYKSYFLGGSSGKMFEFFERNRQARYTKISPTWKELSKRERIEPKEIPPKYPPKDLVSYNIEEQSAFIYLPEGFEPSKEWGIVLFFPNEDTVTLPEEWKAVFKKEQVAFIAANNAGADNDDMRRIALALDSLETFQVDKDFKKPRRIYLMGCGDGGRLALLASVTFPKLAKAVITYAEGLILQKTLISTVDVPETYRSFHGKTTHVFLPVETPWLGANDVKKMKTDVVFYAVEKSSGIKARGDEYERVLRSAFQWDQRKVKHRILDDPECPSAETGAWLQLCFDWLNGAKIKGFEPRWKMFENLNPPY